MRAISTSRGRHQRDDAFFAREGEGEGRGLGAVDGRFGENVESFRGSNVESNDGNAREKEEEDGVFAETNRQDSKHDRANECSELPNHVFYGQ